MSLTCPNVPETIPVVIGNVVQSQTPAQLLAAFAGNVKTPTANFSAHYNGHTLSFRQGVPFVTTPSLLAALTAQGAPIV
jgi:hypothetical protein